MSGALDIAVVLGQAHSTLSGKRKGAICKLLSEDVQLMCSERTPPGSKYLFGDDFLKTGKESKETRTLIKQMAATVEKESYPSKKGYNNKNNGGDSKNWSASNKQKSFLGRVRDHTNHPGHPGNNTRTSTTEAPTTTSTTITTTKITKTATNAAIGGTPRIIDVGPE